MHFVCDRCTFYFVAGESFESHTDDRVIRLRRLSEAWCHAKERGRLQPWRGGFGRPGDDMVRADFYSRLADIIAENPTPNYATLSAFPVGVLAELTNTVPLEDGEHAPLFCDPPTIYTSLEEYSAEAVLAMQQLLKPTANQPLLRNSTSPILQALCASLIHHSPFSTLELQTIGEGKVPLRDGIDKEKLTSTCGGTYTSSGYKDVSTVGQFRKKAQENPYPCLCTHLADVFTFLEDLSDDAPLPREVTAYAGRLDSPTKPLAMRHREHNTSFKLSGARRHFFMHQLCGPPTSFSSVISLEATTTTFRKFSAVISVKSLFEISEALTQSMFNCWHNVDLMGGSEVGGLLKRINKEINRQAYAFRVANPS